jgi:hypothetical protein
MAAALKKMCMVMGLSVWFTVLRAQNTELTNTSSDPNHRVATMPTFFSKDSAQGSPYLVRGWLRGTVDLSDQKRLPEPGHTLFFNYDKLNERLYATDGTSKVWAYPKDSVSNFTLIADSNTDYQFEKVPLISRNHFLQRLVRSEDGYSIYRRVITKFIAANYRNEGYYTTGKSYDQYVDTFDYFLVYPGNRRYTQVNLNVRAIRKAFSADPAIVDKFFAENRGQVDEKTFVVFVNYVNGKK